MNQVLERMQQMGIVPVVVLEEAKDALPLAQALCHGGLPCAEVTFRTSAAKESIRIMKEHFPEMLVGAGTVLTIEQVDQAVEAGAQFIVSPGVNKKVIQHCMDIGIPITPGVTSPTDIDAAMEFGLDVLKFFPAEASGGLAAIKAMSAPYPMLKFMPTGGINEKNITSYIEFDKILACGGSWMVHPDLIRAGAFEKIQEMTGNALLTMLDLRIIHIEREHMTMSTTSVFRAVHYLETKGITVNMETAKYKNDKLMSVDLKDDAKGFALHLLQK